MRLILPALLVCGVALTAASFNQQAAKRAAMQPQVKLSAVSDRSSSPFTLRRVNTPDPQRRLVNPKMKAPRSAGLQEGVLLFESFETDSEDITQMPEGWSTLSYGDADLTAAERWSISEASPFLPGPTDGNKYIGINFSNLNQDEWLVSPQVSIPAEGTYFLYFDAYVDPAFLFDFNYVDWDAYEFTEKHIAANLEVLVSVDGGEFEVVKDFAQDHWDESLREMILNSPAGLEGFEVSLGQYSGQDVRVAFRYVGTDGNTVFLDAVKIALPEMSLEIMPPYETLYWGFDDSADWGYLTLPISMYPVYAPFTYQNYSWNPGAEYSWNYCDPETSQMVSTDEDPDILTLQYHTDYTNAFTTRNNWYYTPQLVGYGEGYSETTAGMEAQLLQAGGQAEYEFQDGSTAQYGLLPYSPAISGIGIYTLDSEKIGDPAIPVFGYNVNSDAYWTDFTFDGDAEEGDSSFVTGYFNYIYPASSPLVVSSVRALAIGQIGENVEFKAEIFPLVDYYEDGEWLGQVIAEEPIASATCLGGDVLGRDPNAKEYLTLPFTFDSPVVLDNSNPAYIVKISGYHNPDVVYFAPAQQWIPNDLGMVFGWYVKEMTWGGITRESLQPLAYRENEYGPMYCAFAINLCGTYPWLHAAQQQVDLGTTGNATVALDSYYDASELTVTAPSWLTVALTGRYGDTLLSISAGDADAEREGEIVIEGPGVKQTIAVGQNITAVTAPSVSGAAVAEILTLDGCRVTDRELTSGLYLVRFSDGTVAKRMVK